MKILLSTWSGKRNQNSPYESIYVSGDKLASRIIAEGLAKKGHEVHYFALSTKTFDKIINGVHVHHVRNPYKNGEIKRYFLVYRKELENLCRKYNIQLIIPRAVHLAGTGAFLVGKKLRIPVVPTVESQDFLFQLRDKNVDGGYKDLIRDTLKKSEGLILLTKHLGEDIKKLERGHAKLHVVNDGVDVERFEKVNPDKAKIRYNPENKKIVICVARMDLPKRQDIIIKAADLVAKKHPGTDFIFVGDGSLLPEIKKLAGKMNHRKHIKFLGFKPNDDIPELLSISDIVVCPTDSEGLPLSLLEGMAAGKPIIASRIPPFTDFIKEGVNGYTVENKEKSFAEGVIHLLDNEKLMKEMGMESRKIVRGYSWKKTIEETNELIEEIRKCF